MVNKTDLLMFAGIEVLAVIGVVIPLLIGMHSNFFLASAFSLLWWLVPGIPVPLVHKFRGGWCPFIMAYPVSMAVLIDGMVNGVECNG